MEARAAAGPGELVDRIAGGGQLSPELLPALLATRQPGGQPTCEQALVVQSSCVTGWPA
jgi:hypothetical protein